MIFSSNYKKFKYQHEMPDGTLSMNYEIVDSETSGQEVEEYMGEIVY